MRSVVRLSVGLCLAASLAACGSTVQSSHQLSSGSDLGDGLSVDGSTGGTSATGTGGALGTTTGSSFGGTTSGSSTGSLGTGGSTTGSSTGGSSTSGTSGLVTSTTGGVKVTSKPIQVGITYVKDAAAGFAAIGISGSTLGDMVSYSKILIADANKHGGLGGRQIKPVFFGYDVNPGSAGYPAQDAQACAAFTQDAHIEVALVNFAGTALNECMRKRGIPMIEDGPTGGISSASLKHFSQLFVMGGLNLDRRAKEQVRALIREKYFSPWDSTNGAPGKAQPTKIGIITYDLPDYTNSVNGPMVQALVAAGYPKPKVVAVAPHDSYDDLAAMTPQIQNAVLAFRAAGVTHVIIWDDNGVSTLFFMEEAENQKYRPRYGINSGNNMQTVGTVASKNQLEGAIGMGWDPSFDVPAAKSPTGKYSNSARKACYDLMVKNKQTGGSGFNETSAMIYCSSIWALKDRWDHMGGSSASGLLASFNAYGSSYIDPQVPSTYLSPTQHDGAAGIYDYSYSGGCSCMIYTGGVQPLVHG